MKIVNVSKLLFPSPTGATYYESNQIYTIVNDVAKFPSPTGATYYECN